MIFLTACSRNNVNTVPTETTSAQQQTEITVTTSAEPVQSEQTTAITSTTEVLDTVAAPDEAEETLNVPGYSLSDEKDILEFLSEKQWYMTDTDTGKDYARLTVLPNGNITLERLDSGLMCDGTLSLKKQYSKDKYDFFEITMKNLSEGFMPDENKGSWMVPDEDKGDYMFYIGTGGGEDYLSIQEIGNGDTFTGTFVFPPAKNDDIYNRSDLLMHRESEYTVSSEPVTDSEFFAYCWKRDDNSMWFEPMTVLEEEAYDEYTDRRFTQASFVPNDEMRIINMPVAPEITGNFLYTEKWESVHPMMMYKVYTNEAGEVTLIEEADTAYYGLYDLGKLPPEISYDGVKFKYNHMTYDLSEDGYVTNAIMNVKQAGNRLVLEGHINPHRSEYLIFNMDRCDFEEPIYGCNLVWQQNDIRTCVYSDDKYVRDYRGNILYTCENEIYLLEITDEGTQLEITPFDAEYNASEEKIKIPYPEYYDAAMYKYSDFLYTRKPSDWYRFMYHAPQKAAMFVITNPPEDILSAAPKPERESFAGNTESVVAAVPLYDHSYIRMYQGTYTFDNDSPQWKDLQNGSDHKVGKGQVIAYYANVPEGIPSEAIYMYNDQFSVDFPIATISGEHVQQSTFIEITAMG
ncbi:MAG: hypothetical protein ILP19_01625, partial [Oscillospiraceae bacterium]|nr:hypothetical protein [Oscillospiraceae bacterium]